MTDQDISDHVQYCERGGERRVDSRIGRGECRGNGMDTIILIVTINIILKLNNSNGKNSRDSSRIPIDTNRQISWILQQI